MRTVALIFYVIAVADFVASYAGINFTPFLPNEIARFTPIIFGGIGFLLTKIADSDENK